MIGNSPVFVPSLVIASALFKISFLMIFFSVVMASYVYIAETTARMGRIKTRAFCLKVSLMINYNVRGKLKISDLNLWFPFRTEYSSSLKDIPSSPFLRVRQE
jgi:hypothetical protein